MSTETSNVEGRRPPPRTGARRLLRNPFLWAGLLGLVTIPILRPFLRRVPAPPAVLGHLPRFALVNQEGKPSGSDGLRGKVWVANFIFTTCRSICPRLTGAMKALRQRYDRESIDVWSVSVTVDPENDTPAVLKGYAQKNGADLTRWVFLTGPEKAVRALIVGGFQTYLGQKSVQSDNLVDIAHASYFVLVDGEGGIRGYYQPDKAGLDELFHRSQHVRREKRRR
jgi:protein SCO1/2